MIVSSPNAAILGIPACGFTGQLPDVAQARGWSCEGRGVLAIRAHPMREVSSYRRQQESVHSRWFCGAWIAITTGQDGFPLMVGAFEGNKAETKDNAVGN